MRLDNRKNDELRKINFIKNFTKNAYSSVLVEFGDTKVIVAASVAQAKPRWMEKDDPRGWITAEYSLLPSSTNTRNNRERSKVSGRTREIERLIGRSLRSCTDLYKIPDLSITIDADVIQADGGTRCASICGGFLALKMAFEKLIKENVIAENPIIEPIAAVSVGIFDDEVILDLNYEEDSNCCADSNIVLTKSGKIVEFQTTAEEKPFEEEKLSQMLEYAKKDCEIYNSAYMNLDEVIDVIVKAESEGKNIVRLHTGDPSLYGAIREQIEELAKHGITCEICPGVSSFLAAAAAMNCEYTVPEVAQSVIITRMPGRTPVPDNESIAKLAAHGTSMVIFLSSSHLKELKEELYKGAYTPDTPCAICYKASWKDEKCIKTTLENLDREAEKAGITKTALIMVGEFLGDKYSFSKLYDPEFKTEYRK